MWKAVKKSIFITLGIFLAGGLLVGGWLWYLSRDLPDLEELERFEPDVVSTVYASDGQILTEFGIKNRTLIPLDSIPDYVKDAILSTEDRKFYTHWGMDLRRFTKAVMTNITHGFGSGGASTLTQQLARTLHLNQQETIKRKLQELIVAILIERTYSKTEILEMYLNSSFWGHGCYGIQAATDYYFSKEVQDLTLDESAMLIGILPAPSRFTPRFYHDRAIRRRNLVLRNMVRTEKISQQEFMDALSSSTPVNHIENKSAAPYFTEYVRLEVAQFCRSQGIDYYRDGLQIYTTLDHSMQDIAREALRERLVDQQDELNKSLLSSPEFLLKIYKQYFPNQHIPMGYFSKYLIVSITPNEARPPIPDKPILYKYYFNPLGAPELSGDTSAVQGDSALSLSPLHSELRQIVPLMSYDSLEYRSALLSSLLPDDQRMKLKKDAYKPFIMDTLYQDTTLYRYFLTDSLRRDSITFDSRTWYTIIVDSTSLVMDSLLAALPLKPKTAQASIFAVDPASGAIRVMVGGRNFEESKFNRAV
ncbi:MAG: transglycosylase domain-containing protein, partial [Candidatus Marinimicrobia bacterium]|nr:transglycosylase domain-containing protein [Candidatus Neomarinimicrobiota bacterium]